MYIACNFGEMCLILGQNLLCSQIFVNITCRNGGMGVERPSLGG